MQVERAFAMTLIVALGGAGCGSDAAPGGGALTPSEADHEQSERAIQGLVIPTSTGPMVAIDDDVYAEAGTGEEGRARLSALVERARARVRDAFPTLRAAPPLVLLCETAECKVSIVGDSPSARAADFGRTLDGVPGVIVRPTVLVTSSSPRADRILAHELVHVEMGARVPYELLPTWFNEGMATLLAGEPGCEGVRTDSIEDLRDLDSKAGWEAHVADRRAILPTYCQSRSEVEAWIGAYPEEVRPATLEAMLDAVRDGARFDEVYGPLRAASE